MKAWKRNAVVAAIILFVGAAVYLNWSYSQKKSDISAEALPTGKLLGGATLVAATAQPTDNGGSLLASPAPEGTEAKEEGNTAPSSDYFSNARINRQQARDSALSLLEEAAASDTAGQTVRDEANASIQTLAACTIAEAEIESLVTAKGYSECVAFVGQDSASIVVSLLSGRLTEADTAKIMEIAMERTGMEAGQIKVIQAE